MGILIEPLGKHHDRAKFSCGQPDLDDWQEVELAGDRYVEIELSR